MRITIATLAVLGVTVGTAAGQQPGTEDPARVIADYNRMLNACDVEGIVRVYERDGMFMPPNQPAAVGDAGLRAWAKNYCSRTVANLKFVPVEVQRASDWAWVRVAVTGTTTVKATGAATQQDNKALFILRRGTDGAWRIARYAINSNKPAATTATR